MVDQINIGRLLLRFGRHHAVLLFDDRNALITRRSQADKVFVESFHIFVNYFRRIAFRVDADKYDGHIFGLLTQLIDHLAVSQQAGRADIRTVGITESQQNDFPFQAADGKRLAVARSQREITADIVFPHVGAEKFTVFGRDCRCA